LLQRVYGNASRATVMMRFLIGLGLAAIFSAALVGGGNQYASARPTILGIDHVRLYVNDMTKSRSFYGGAMGLPAGGGNCVGEKLPCFSVNGEQYVELEPVPSPAPQNWVAEVVFATSDVEGMRRYLIERKVSPGPVSSDGAALHFYVSDPEGNRIGFVQRSGAKAAFKSSPKQISTRMLHAGFVVKDMAAENKFYRDVLGFRVYWYGGFKDNDTDWYELQVPDGGDWIEYMLNIPANADHKELGVQNHFSLGVKDAGAAAAQLKKQGLAKFDGPEVGRDGKNSLDAYDPDGTRVEVMDFTPRQTPCCHAYEAAHPSP
jgi:catechol 2,3-dioxygenase-like lactoylglutathione lyase family enzyme